MEENQVQCENLTEELPPAKDSRDFYFRAMKASNWISGECKRLGVDSVARRLGLSSDALGDILAGRWEARLDEILWAVCDGKIPMRMWFSEESILREAETILDRYASEAGVLVVGMTFRETTDETENPQGH